MTNNIFRRLVGGGGITVGGAMDLFLESRRARGLRSTSITNYRVFRNWMTREYGPRPLRSLTPEVVGRIRARKSRDFALMVLTAQRWAVEERLLPRSFELARFPASRRDEDAVPCRLSPEDAHRFLDAVRIVDAEMWPIFLIAFFAGVRPAECTRLTWSQIIVEERRIRIEAWQSKVRRPRNIERLPSVLWDLLPPAPAGGGRIIPEEREDHAMFRWIRARRAAGAEARVTLEHDIIRHTFATYHVALTGSPSRTAKILGHANIGVLARDYDGVGTRAEARTYFGYAPLLAA